MNMSEYSGSESKWLKASDFLGKNLKVTIEGVEIIEFDETDKAPAQKRSALTFVDKEKGLILNPSNNDILCQAYGEDDGDWIGREIGLTTKEYDAFKPGWIVQPLDVKPKDFDDDIPF